MEWKFGPGERISFVLLRNGKIKGFVFLFEEKPWRTEFVGEFLVSDKLRFADGTLQKVLETEAGRQGRIVRQDTDLKNVFWVT